MRKQKVCVCFLSFFLLAPDIVPAHHNRRNPLSNIAKVPLVSVPWRHLCRHAPAALHQKARAGQSCEQDADQIDQHSARTAGGRKGCARFVLDGVLSVAVSRRHHRFRIIHGIRIGDCSIPSDGKCNRLQRIDIAVRRFRLFPGSFRLLPAASGQFPDSFRAAFGRVPDCFRV